MEISQIASLLEDHMTWEASIYKEAREAFCKQMRDRDYGLDALSIAWEAFAEGWMAVGDEIADKINAEEKLTDIERDDIATALIVASDKLEENSLTVARLRPASDRTRDLQYTLNEQADRMRRLAAKLSG